MIDALAVLLRVAGAGLILLAVLHIPISRHLRWREESERMSLASASVFRVHTFFICVVLALMGLPALVSPQIFLEPSTAGAWLTWSIAAFWALRLFFQFFVYPAELWRGKRFETAMHVWFSLVWASLMVVFVLCGLVQLGRLG